MDLPAWKTAKARSYGSLLLCEKGPLVMAYGQDAITLSRLLKCALGYESGSCRPFVALASSRRAVWSQQLAALRQKVVICADH